jgi:hypothetical protein
MTLRETRINEKLSICSYNNPRIADCGIDFLCAQPSNSNALAEK